MAITVRQWSAWMEVVPAVALKSRVTEWWWRDLMLARRVDYKDADGSKGTSWFDRDSILIPMIEIPRGCLEVVRERPV